MAFFLFSQEEGKGDAEQTRVSRFDGKKNPRPETKDYGESMKDGGDLLRRFSVKDKGEKRKKGSAAVQSLGRQEIEKREKEIAEEKIEGQGRKIFPQKKDEKNASKKPCHGSGKGNENFLPKRKVRISRSDLRAKGREGEALNGNAKKSKTQKMPRLVKKDGEQKKKRLRRASREKKKKPRKKEEKPFHRQISRPSSPKTATASASSMEKISFASGEEQKIAIWSMEKR